MADISIDEANRIRASLGMKPLPGGSGPIFKEASPAQEEEEAASTLETRQEEGYENYRKLRELEKKKKDREARVEAIKKERDAAQRFSKLEGKGLGDTDGDDMDTKSWLIKQKKRQKAIEQARKKEQEEVEEEARRQAEYTAKDLAGVKVGHELDSFEEGDEQVLTLKDTTIDANEEEGDELENLDLREREKLERNLDLKKKKPVYNPHDMDDSGEIKILAQYDEEIDGQKTSRFTLDGQGSTTEQRQALLNGETLRSKPKAISLDFLKDEQPASDYLDISATKMKKPKKKKAKSTRQKALDDDDILHDDSANTVADDNAMVIDQPVSAPQKRSFQDMSFVDDDDLAASLAASRRDALKKRKRIRPEDIARQLREEVASPNAEDEEQTGGLVIDETSEFVANLHKPIEEESRRPRSISRPAENVTAMDGSDDDEDVDVDMDQSYANIEDEDDLKARLKLEQEESQQGPSTGIEDEGGIDNGVGAALTLLKGRGILKSSSDDLNANFVSKQRFLAERHRREAAAETRAREQRERDRTGKLQGMSAKDREAYARHENERRDQQESRLLAEHFNKEYKPNVELKYLDEHGRSLNSKEAFKHLSHHFHGKTSGKAKTEKLLAKIEAEKQRESRSLLDGSAGSGMSSAAASQTKKNRQAGVRLA